MPRKDALWGEKLLREENMDGSCDSCPHGVSHPSKSFSPLSLTLFYESSKMPNLGIMDCYGGGNLQIFSPIEGARAL